MPESGPPNDNEKFEAAFRSEHGPPPDGENPEVEQHWYAKREAERIHEKITPEVLIHKLHENFYLKDQSQTQVLRFLELEPRSNLLLGEVTGLPAIGKHKIQTHIEALLTTHTGEDLIIPQQTLENLSGKPTYKKFLEGDPQHLDLGPFISDNALFTRLELHRAYNKIFKDEQQRPYCITTWGPTGAAQIMLQQWGPVLPRYRYTEAHAETSKKRTELLSQMWDARTRDLIRQSQSIQEIVDEMTPEAYEKGLATMAGLLERNRLSALLPLPLAETPIPITFISGLSIDHCLENFERPSEIRTIARPYSKRYWDVEDLVTMRGVHALLIKTNPEIFIEINTEVDPEGFAEKNAKLVLRKSMEIARKYGAEVEFPDALVEAVQP